MTPSEFQVQSLNSDARTALAFKLLAEVWDDWVYRMFPNDDAGFQSSKLADEVWDDWTDSFHDQVRGEM